MQFPNNKRTILVVDDMPDNIQFEPSFKRFAKAVENYDFEQALAELNILTGNEQ